MEHIEYYLPQQESKFEILLDIEQKNKSMRLKVKSQNKLEFS